MCIRGRFMWWAMQLALHSDQPISVLGIRTSHSHSPMALGVACLLTTFLCLFARERTFLGVTRRGNSKLGHQRQRDGVIAPPNLSADVNVWLTLTFNANPH